MVKCHFSHNTGTPASHTPLWGQSWGLWSGSLCAVSWEPGKRRRMKGIVQVSADGGGGGSSQCSLASS